MAPRRLGFWQWMAAAIIVPVMRVWTKPIWLGTEHLPRRGGFIIVPNHSSHFDPLPLADFIFGTGVWPRFLGKASVFRIPLIGRWLLHIKQVPVERGTVEAARSVEALTRAVRDGGAVVIYPEGTTTREPDLWPMRGKTGAARIALATGAPVVPVVMWGPHRVFDPRGPKFHPGVRVPIVVKAGPPVDLSRWRGTEPTKETLDEMTETIMLRLRDMLAEVRGGTPPPLWQPPAGPALPSPQPGHTDAGRNERERKS